MLADPLFEKTPSLPEDGRAAFFVFALTSMSGEPGTKKARTRRRALFQNP